MPATYIIGAGQTLIQGCLEQPGTMLETSYSGLETLTFSFRGKPDDIFALQLSLPSFATPPIAGNWSNFRVTSTKITENDGVWARLSCVAKGVRGNPPEPNVRWTKQQQAVQNVIYGGQRYPTLYYLSPTTIISRVQAIPNGSLAKPVQSNPEFGDDAAVELLTQSGYVSVVMGGAFRSCLEFDFEQQGIYWDIRETYGITIPQPGEGSEFTFNSGAFSIRGYYNGPNYTNA